MDMPDASAVASPDAIPIPIAVVGIGKIARDQHLPAIAAHPRFVLAGTVSPDDTDCGVPAADTITALARAVPALRAVALCTPPAVRPALVAEALAAGLDILVEKPPAATLSDAERYAAAARKAGRALLVAWHAREAAGVAPLADWVADRTLRRIAIRWREDVHVWHPGQEWIWQPGVGVFDPGINALSILTRVLARDVTVCDALLGIPAGRDAPIDARLRLVAAGVGSIEAEFDFDARDDACWTIAIDSDTGSARLDEGGARLTIDGAERVLGSRGEYPRLYDHFAALIDTRGIDADLSPFRLVADAFLLARREPRGRFAWTQ